MEKSVVCVQDHASLAGLRSEWTRLEGKSQNHSLCATFSYCALAANRRFQLGEPIYVVRIFEGGELVLIWPIVVEREGWVRIARDLRCQSGEDYGGPLIRHGASTTVFRFALDCLKDLKADIFDLSIVDDTADIAMACADMPRAPAISALPKQLRQAPGEDGFPRYQIDVAEFDSVQTYLASRSSSTRSTYNKRFRQLLSEQKDVQFGWCQTFDEAEQVLRWLFQVKRQWAQAKGIRTAYLQNDQLRDFYIGLARQTDLAACPLVVFIKVKGQIIAASVNLVGPAVLEGAVTTFDGSFSRYSPGILLLHYILEWCFIHRRALDMRYVHADYKAQWANHVEVCRRHRVFLSTGFFPLTQTIAGLGVNLIADYMGRGLRKGGNLLGQKLEQWAVVRSWKFNTVTAHPTKATAP